MATQMFGGARSVKKKSAGYLVLVEGTNHLEVLGLFCSLEEGEQAAQEHTKQTERKSWVLASIGGFDSE
jgi:hypothetical protein